MSNVRVIPFLEEFKTLEDPRIERKKLYPLDEILLVLLCGTICYAESWRDLVTFGEERIDFLRQYLPFENGIPSKNTYSRVMSALDSKTFKSCFNAWVRSFHFAFKHVAIDGKRLRRSHDKKQGQSAIHMVSAFATEARLVLGQTKVDDKSNEITAIPQLLDSLNVSGLIVSIDAMGCQKAIAEKIINKKADYVFSLKGNQGDLEDDVRIFLDAEIKKLEHNNSSSPSHLKHCEEFDKGHGRIEHREYWITDKIQWLRQKDNWTGLRCIGCVKSTREHKGIVSTECRYFISSLDANPEQFSKAVRNHWAIENNLHWTLDVVFNEDQSRVRSKNASQNMAIIRHCVMNLLQSAKSLFKKDMSLKGLRKKAAWGNKTLETILAQEF